MSFVGTFSYSIKYRKGKENVVADALPRRYNLVTTLGSKLFGLEHIKDLYENDLDFGSILEKAKSRHGGRFSMIDEYLCFDGKLCIPHCSFQKLLVRESHNGGLMGHFSVTKTLTLLQAHFYWPRMKRDVAIVIEGCIKCREAKS